MGGVVEWGGVGGREEGTIGTDDDGSPAVFPLGCFSVGCCLHCCGLLSVCTERSFFAVVEVRFDFVPSV